LFITFSVLIIIVTISLIWYLYQHQYFDYCYFLNSSLHPLMNKCLVLPPKTYLDALISSIHLFQFSIIFYVLFV